MVLQQITIHKPLRALCGRLNVLVKAVSLLFKVSAAAWIINSLELCRREDLNHAWKMVSGASPVHTFAAGDSPRTAVRQQEASEEQLW